MDGVLSNSITAVGSAAAQRVASALSPRNTASQTTGATAKASGTSSSDTNSTTDEATITGADFLTLLVSELKNQDPTQPTDPNAYIQQLVGVNSLQQLIGINQGVTALATPITTSPSSNQ